MGIRSFAVFWVHEYFFNPYIDLSKSLHTSFGIRFSWYNELAICQIQLRRFSEVFPVSTYAISLGNLCSCCFGSTLIPLPGVGHCKTSIFIESAAEINDFDGLGSIWYWDISDISFIIDAVVEGLVQALMFFQNYQGVYMLFRIEAYYP